MTIEYPENPQKNWETIRIAIDYEYPPNKLTIIKNKDTSNSYNCNKQSNHNTHFFSLYVTHEIDHK